MQQQQLKNVIEAVLMSAEKPLKVNDIEALFVGDTDMPSRNDIRKALQDLTEDYQGRGFELKEVASGFRIQVVQDYAEWVGRLWEEKPARYTRALLETLALIAYRQPITRGEIEEVRGVSVSSNIIKTLQEREWIKVLGHKDVPGKPALYGTSKTFLDYFNLKSLEDLPTLAELKDLDQIHRELDLDIDNTEAQADQQQQHEEQSEAALAAETDTKDSDAEPDAAQINEADAEPVATETDEADLEPDVALTDEADIAPDATETDEADVKPVAAETDEVEEEPVAAETDEVEEEPVAAETDEADVATNVAETDKTDVEPDVVEVDEADIEPDAVEADKVDAETVAEDSDEASIELVAVDTNEDELEPVAIAADDDEALEEDMTESEPQRQSAAR